jgi:hypothetical protein
MAAFSFSPAIQFASKTDANIALKGICQHHVHVRVQKHKGIFDLMSTKEYEYKECEKCTQLYEQELNRLQQEKDRENKKDERIAQEHQMLMREREIALQVAENALQAEKQRLTTAEEDRLEEKMRRMKLAETPPSSPTVVVAPAAAEVGSPAVTPVKKTANLQM